MTIAAQSARNTANIEEYDMAQRVSAEDVKPATRLVAEARELEPDRWAGVFAVPGLAPDYVRDRDLKVRVYDKEIAAKFAAMATAINVFNVPRERMVQSKTNRISDVRPAKMGKGEFAKQLAECGLQPGDFADITDKPVKRVMGWLNGEQDIPHEVRLLLAIFRAFPEAIDLAERVTDEAMDETERRGG